MTSDRLAPSVDLETTIPSYLASRLSRDLVTAFAVAYDLDYLVTWNCKHIANGSVIRRLTQINQRLHRATPVIVTPEELQPETFEGGSDDL